MPWHILSVQYEVYVVDGFQIQTVVLIRTVLQINRLWLLLQPTGQLAVRIRNENSFVISLLRVFICEDIQLCHNDLAISV